MNLKSVALPSEHGGWGFLLEPVLLGLLVAPSGPGVLLALAAVGVFLSHQPLKIAVKDRLKGQRPPRTVWAERFAVGYGLLALVPLLLLLLTAPAAFLLPLLLAVPLAGVQLYYDARNQSRRLAPEMCGAAALAMIAPALAVLAGHSLAAGLILWLLLALRALTSILYVRARLKLEQGKPVSAAPVLAAHGAALVMVLALWAVGQVPWLAIIALAVLGARAAFGLSRYRTPRPAKIIGFQEVGYGLVTVLAIAGGYLWQW
ncbi:MAG: YwiC-like family protein [Anaerolineae bacterium]|nr:YwiC-like family protein [Anaerolineae bacterium]